MSGFVSSGSGGVNASAMANAEALKSMHTMALLLSASVDDSPQARRVMSGFCGGGGDVLSAPRRQPVAADRGSGSSCGVVLGREARATTFDALAGSCCTPPGVSVSVAVRGNDCSSVAVQTSQCGDAQAQALAQYGGSSGFFEDTVAALMIKVVKDFQDKIEERLKKLEEQAKAAEQGKKKKKKKGGFGAVLGVVGAVAGAFVGMPQVGYMVGSAVGGAVDKKRAESDAKKDAQQNGSQESRNIEFEKIKFDMQKLSQMQQAMSNVLNSMDELAKSAIRQIKGG
jgi:hypothetical protein